MDIKYNELAEDDKSEFKEAYEKLETAINDFDEETAGCELYSVEEVIDSPDDVVDASEDIEVSDTGKRKFEFGEIRKLSKEEKDLQEEAMRSLENPFEQGEE